MARLTPQQLRDAATVAQETGMTITIEAGSRVYKISPTAQEYPMFASEKDIAECNAAFGPSD